jgi:hypothetical protein
LEKLKKQKCPFEIKLPLKITNNPARNAYLRLEKSVEKSSPLFEIKKV